MTQTKQEAIRQVARVAMADLYGMSQPPPGVADKYPFNACAHRDALPAEWRDDAEDAICYVYHHERMPDVD